MKLAQLPLREFLVRLREEEHFAVGTREMLRAELVRLMIEKGNVEADAEVWSLHLAPVICASQAEQRTFRRFFTSHFSSQEQEVPEHLTDPSEHTAPGAGVIKRRLLISAGAVLVASVLIAAGTWWLSQHQGTATNGSAPSQTDFQPASAGHHNGDTAVFRALGVVTPIFLLATLFLWRFVRYVALVADPGRSMPRSVLRFGREQTQYFRSDRLRTFIHSIQRRWTNGPSIFAPVRSVETAASNAGFAIPQFRRRSTRPRYLILVRHRTWADHAAAAGRELCRLMMTSQVDVDVDAFAYVDYPSLLIPLEDGVNHGIGATPARTLQSALEQHAESLTILVDDGEGLLDPLSLALAPEAAAILAGSRKSVILSPAVVEAWGAREQILAAAGFLILPCDAQGLEELSRLIVDGERADVATADPLTYAAERQSAKGADDGLRWYPPILTVDSERFMNARAPAADEVDALLEELARYLGRDGFIWLAAVAAYPLIRPELTRELGILISGRLARNISEDQSYLAIARLPWVVRGWMPDWLRGALLKAQAPHVADAIRSVLEDLLSGPKPKAAVALHFTKGSTWWPATRSERRHAGTKYVRDAVALRFMGKGRRLLYPPAPEWLQRLIPLKMARWAGTLSATLIALAASIIIAFTPESEVDSVVAALLSTLALSLFLWNTGKMYRPLSLAGLLASMYLAATMTSVAVFADIPTPYFAWGILGSVCGFLLTAVRAGEAYEAS